MISAEQFKNKLEEIARLEYKERELRNNENVFDVDLNTREIKVPMELKQLGVKGDHKAETLWFALDRYYDGVDLSLDRTWAVQYTNALGESGLDPIDWKNRGKVDPAGENGDTILLGWDIKYDLTKAAGNVRFSLRCFHVPEDNLIIDYSLSTKTVSATIADGLYITESKNHLLNPPKDNLTDLVNKISKLYTNESLTNLDYTKINPETLPRLQTEVDGDFDPFYAGDYKTTEWGADYNKSINTPSINGIPLKGNKTDAELGIKVEVDASLSATSANPIQNKAVKSALDSVNDQITKIWEEMDGMTYIPLSILSFAAETPLQEKGVTVTEMKFTWSLSDTPKGSALINNVDTGVSTKDGEYNLQSLSVTEKTNFTLLVRDKKGNEFTATAPIDFAQLVYYGAFDAVEDYSTLLGKLNSNLQQTRAGEFNAEAAVNKYIYFAVPESYGACTFTSGGFTGGFEKVSNIQHANAYGYVSKYDIYRSVEAGLGQTTFIVS